MQIKQNYSRRSPINKRTKIQENLVKKSLEEGSVENPALITANDFQGLGYENIRYLHKPYFAETIAEKSLKVEEDDTPFQKNIWNQEMAAIYLIEQGTNINKDYQRFIIHVSEI